MYHKIGQQNATGIHGESLNKYTLCFMCGLMNRLTGRLNVSFEYIFLWAKILRSNPKYSESGLGATVLTIRVTKRQHTRYTLNNIIYVIVQSEFITNNNKKKISKMYSIQMITSGVN